MYLFRAMLANFNVMFILILIYIILEQSLNRETRCVVCVYVREIFIMISMLDECHIMPSNQMCRYTLQYHTTQNSFEKLPWLPKCANVSRRKKGKMRPSFSHDMQNNLIRLSQVIVIQQCKIFNEILCDAIALVVKLT